MSEEKTEKPTPKKNKENRKEGQVPRTQELGAWASMLLVGAFLPKLLAIELNNLRELMVASLRAAENASPALALQLAAGGAKHIGLTLLLLGAAVMVVGVAGALSQGGFYLATKSLKPKLSKLDPIQGAKRVFGLQALWEGAKMLLKASVVTYLGYLSIRGLMPMVGTLAPVPMVLETVADDARSLVINVSVAGVVLAVADYAFQRRKVGKSTRMTKDEVKREHKQSEGDPLVKSAIRSRQLAAARNRMMSDVPTADVVLVNPTHVAVALRYEPENGAPRVVARGAGVVAARIREAASEAEVPLVRDVPLARALYSSTKVGQEIPIELFGAVAQVLAFVISRRTRGQRGGRHDTPRGPGELPETSPVRRRRPNPAAASPSVVASVSR